MPDILRFQLPSAVEGDPATIRDFPDDSVSCLSRLYHRNGDLTVFSKGNRQKTLVGFGPQVNRTVFGQPDIFHIVGPPGPRGSSHRGFQQGLLGLNGAQHVQHRRLLRPGLSKPMVMRQREMMVSIIESYLDQWRYGKDIDLYAEMKTLSIKIAGKLLFGLDEIPNAATVAATFQSWLDAYIKILLATTLPILNPSIVYETMLQSAEQLEAQFRDIIVARRSRLREDDHDLLAILLRAHRDGIVSHEEVVGELHTLFNASYQTTASALTWTQTMLATHPHVAMELHDELERGGEDHSASLNQRVINESLRILPPVVFTARQVMRSTTIGGEHLPAGSYVLLSIYVTHHQEDLFPKPQSFLPDRWRNVDPSPYSYLPFGAGPRKCLGASFGLELLRVAIPCIFRRFQCALPAGVHINRHSNLTLGIDGSLPVRLLQQVGRRPKPTTVQGNLLDMVQIPSEAQLRRAA